MLIISAEVRLFRTFLAPVIRRRTMISSVTSRIGEVSSVTGSEDDAALAPFRRSISLVGRATETQQLLAALKRASLSKAPTEIILIHGYSGVGKTAMLDSAMQQRLPQDNCFFASGKYDQNKEGEMPLSAFVNATKEIIDGIQVSHRKRAVMTRIQDTLTEAELVTLAEVFSYVSLLFPAAIKKSPREESKSLQVQATEASLIRMMNIYRRLLSAIAEENCPLIIFLDDLQWADDASRQLLASIMSDKELCNIVLVGTIRDGEDETFEPPSTVNGRVTKIVLSNLEETELNNLVANALNDDPLHTKALSHVVFSRTMGNPFFVKHFLDALYREQLITVDKTTGSFKWDSQMIAMRMKPSMDVAHMLVSAIETLDRKTQCVLIIASVLGHSFTADVLEVITGSIDLVAHFRTTMSSPIHSYTDDSQSTDLDDDSTLIITSKELEKSLQQARLVNLIESTEKDNGYRFIHDRVQQAALSMLPQGKTGRQIKATLGTLMLELARSNTSSSDDWMMYSAINLILKYGTTDHGPNEIASLCAQASKKSMRQTAFKSASKYAGAGIKILGPSCWKDDDTYELCLELHNLDVESLFCNGDYKRCKRRIATIRTECRDVGHRFRAFNVLLNILLAEDAFESCVAECQEALRDLGLKTYKKASSISVVANLFKTWRLVNGRSPKDLEMLPNVDNLYMEEASTILTKLARAAYSLSDENQLVLCCLQIFQIILRYGINKTAPSAFAMYGLVLANIGDLESGYEYGASAISIANRPDMACALAASTAATHCFLTHLKRPLLDTRAYFAKAIETGLQFGDSYNASDHIRSLSWLGIHAGSTITQHERDLQENCRILRDYKNRSNLALVLPCAQFVENVRGRTSNPTLLKGTFTDETKTIASFMKSDKTDQGLLHQILTLHSFRVLLMYLYGQHVEAEEDRLRHVHLKHETGTIMFVIFNNVYWALNCYALAQQHETKLKKRRKYIRIAENYVKTLKKMGKMGSPTIAAVVALLDAERLTCKRRILKAEGLYRKAIQLLHESHFHMLEAIAYERLALCLRIPSGETNRNELRSKSALREAWTKFRCHGASMKCDRMRADYGEEAFTYLP